MVAPAPVVTEHAAVFRDLFDHQCQLRPCQHEGTGLIVLPTKSLAHMARGILASADNTNLSRVLAEAPGREDAVNRRRIRFRLPQTTPHRRRRRASRVVIDDPLCEPVGSLLDSMDRPYHHSAGTSPLAQNPVTSGSVSGPVRGLLGLRRDRRDEARTQGAACVAKPCPALTIPTAPTGRKRLHQPVDPTGLQDPACRARHQPVRTTIALAIELVEEAIRHQVPVGVVVCDAWSLAEDVVRVLARRRQDGISRLKTNRLLETASLQVRDAHGWPLQLPSPPIAVEDLVPLIPASAYRPVTIGEHT